MSNLSRLSFSLIGHLDVQTLFAKKKYNYNYNYTHESIERAKVKGCGAVVQSFSISECHPLRQSVIDSHPLT